MKQNIGNTDRIVRAVLGIALVLIGLLVKMTSPVLPIILVVLGVILARHGRDSILPALLALSHLNQEVGARSRAGSSESAFGRSLHSSRVAAFPSAIRVFLDKT